MPPANSPVAPAAAPTPLDARAADTSPATSTYTSTLDALGYPVLDLTSTLSHRPEDDVDADNVSFLRTPLEPEQEPQRNRVGRENSADERRRRRRQEERTQQDPAQDPRQRDLQHYRAVVRAQEIWQDRINNRTRSPYGDRAPSQQNLYDWAPATEGGDEEDLAEFIAEYRTLQPHAPPEVLRVLARAQMEADRDARYRNQTARAGNTAPNQQGPEPSLRSAAILQSVRRNHRFSARSRDLMQRYILERERARQDGEMGARDEQNLRRLAHPNETASPRPNELGSRYLLNRMAWQASQLPPDNSQGTHRDHLETLRRRYLDTPNPKPSEFERIIKYLYSIRSEDHELDSPDARLFDSIPEDAPLHMKLNAQTVSRVHRACPPPPTSWLAPGTKFSGCQQAAPLVSSGATLHRLANNRNSAPNAFDPAAARPGHLEVPRLWLNQNPSTTPPRMSPSPAPATSSSSQTQPQDRWTVKVKIHVVDYEKMTLQGTMEAYNMPPYGSTTDSGDHGRPGNSTSSNTGRHSTSKTTFSTYLEGELIDFKNHTLLTESDFKVKTTPEIDAAYWRKLEPFAKLTDEEIAKALLDRKWIEDELMGRYVLMRWKERCFVRPTFTASLPSAPSRDGNTPSSPPALRPPPAIPDPTTSFLPGTDGAGYGLSISGFYYVSLRRSDGRCEGLYFDPQSTPYQHLELKPTHGKWGMGSWEFR